jgi:hypothetical protein
MVTTFLKRQKEMKRQEKQRDKAERRKQKSLAKRTKDIDPAGGVDSTTSLSASSQPDPAK